MKQIGTMMLLVACAAPLAAQGRGQAAPSRYVPPNVDAATMARARQIHDRVMTLDTHVDINPGNFRTDTANYGSELRTQVDVVKMEKGGLDAAFLIVYVGQGELTEPGYTRAYEQALEKFRAIHRLTDSIAPSRVGLARTPEDARRIYASGKKVILIGIENGYPIGTDLSRIKQFADLGGRYLSLSHNGHSQLSDSNTGERDNVWLHNGVSALGRQAIAELNRWGVMIDISHPSKASMMQTIELSKAPIIASHSGVRAICGHSRNLDDEQLQALKRNGGVVQLVAFNAYVKCNAAVDRQRTDALDKLRAEYGIPGGGRGAGAAVDALPEARRNAYNTALEQINTQFPQQPAATVVDFADHIDHVVKLIGIDHAGISSDFDGGGGVDGWRDANETFNVTLELVRRGYSEQDIARIWSGNLLRVLGEVQRVSRSMQAAN